MAQKIFFETAEKNTSGFNNVNVGSVPVRVPVTVTVRHVTTRSEYRVRVRHLGPTPLGQTTPELQ